MLIAITTILQIITIPLHYVALRCVALHCVTQHLYSTVTSQWCDPTSFHDSCIIILKEYSDSANFPPCKTIVQKHCTAIFKLFNLRNSLLGFGSVRSTTLFLRLSV